MDEQQKLYNAGETYKTICQMLDAADWKYDRDDDKLVIWSGVRGEDLNIDIVFSVDAERQVVVLSSKLPFFVQEDKRVEAAIAVSAVNYLLADGCFDYNFADGAMYFRMTNSFMESQLSVDVFAYMLYCATQTVDKFNDRFLMVSAGRISVDQFLSALDD